MHNLLPRAEYLQKLRSLQHTQLIKVITGIRRCGKSTLLKLFQQELLKQGVEPQRIVALNFEDYATRPLRNLDKLYAYLTEHIQTEGYTYFFLDEIQQVERFQEVVDSLYLRDNVDIYVTGSNAKLLSGEIATLLTGRYVELPLLPLSFKEFLAGSAKHSTLLALYNAYASLGSFPYLLQLQDKPEVATDYLNSLYNTIVLRDIIDRGKITDSLLLESITHFVMDNIGNLLSPKRIADTLTSYGRRIDVRTIEKYLAAMLECFLTYQAVRYDVKGKQLLKGRSKYYLVDSGLRFALLGSQGYDVGRILENIIYLELRRRGAKVYVGTMGKLEIDFVAVMRQGLAYYQVAATVRDAHTLQRELAPLVAIRNSYPKYILTLDEDLPADYEGIRRLNALKWLLGEEE